jgi:hypothetical protein
MKRLRISARSEASEVPGMEEGCYPAEDIHMEDVGSSTP